ncbi:MAG: hypothetical protein IT537_27165 [Hyphomicrobiales bacterium]|nr:hypothetical protein [Hyphomicrobiales bacterium]
MLADLKQLLLLSILNPAAILVGYWFGRRADQVQKVVIGGFVAGVAGVLFIWLLGKLGVWIGNPRAVGGAFVTCFVAGMIWAYVGWRVQQLSRRR